MQHDDSGAAWELKTTRLMIRRATPCQRDISLLLELWTDPAVMSNVGFPGGLKTSGEKIEKQLREYPDNEFDCVLVATLTHTNDAIGECKLGSPDPSGVAHTDIKLLPRYWGKGYAKEIKETLLGYLFDHTDCQSVRATPNTGNMASIRLQESVGGRRTGEGICRFPENMKAYTRDVPYFEYTVSREDWISANSG